jgi:hypothetical protein
MSWWNPFKKTDPVKELPKAVVTPDQYSAPIGPSPPPYQGPVQRGTDEQVFRETGRSSPSGSSSGGGGGGSSSYREKTKTPALANVPEGNVEEELEKKSPKTIVGRGSSTSVTQVKSAEEKKIKVSPSGAVTIGEGTKARTYVGGATLPGMGVTAQQYSTGLKREAVSRGEISQRDFGKVGFVGTLYPNGGQVQVPDYKQGFSEPSKVSFSVPEFRDIREFSGGTIQTPTTPQITRKLYSPGTIYQVQTGTDKYLGKDIAIVETYYVQPDWSSRDATLEERNILETDLASKYYLKIATSPTSSKFYRYYDEQKGKLKEFSSKPFYDVQATEEFFAKGGTAGKVVGGLFTGIVPSTKGGVLTTGLITLGSAGAGFVVKGITAGATIISPTLGKGIKLGSIGAGVYLGGTYAVGKGIQFSMAEGAFEKSQVIGSGVRELGAGFVGYRVGSKAFDMASGYWRTRGRIFIELPQGEYPQASTSKQLQLFEKNIVKEFGNKPGAFHTTGKTFWKSGTITPAKGTSELPGLYGSTQISTPFARIPGSSGTKTFPTIADLTSTPGSPGVAYLKPEGFRVVPSKPGIWGAPAKEGYADLPLIKTEIEAIFRPDAGSYAFESGGYFTRIGGVRVPIDVFGYYGAGTSSTAGAIFSPSAYSVYSPPALITPEAGITSFVSTSSSSTKPLFSYSLTPPKVTSSFSQPSRGSSSATPSTSLSSSISKISKSSSKIFGSSALSSATKSSLAPSSALSSLIKGGSSKGSSSISGSYIPRSPPPIVAPPRLRFGERDGGLRKIPASRKYSYFPSFKALAFGIRGRGKRPLGTKRFTGLETRPIFNKFKLGKLPKVPKTKTPSSKIKKRRRNNKR